MTGIYKLLILLPKDRRIHGQLFCLGPQGEILFDCPALGKADSSRARHKDNPTRSPVLPYGDTPCGNYRPSEVIPLHPAHPRIGELWIPLEGEDGDAALAHSKGRRGLGIHAGRGDDRLVPTFGCVRLLDQDMQHIHQLAGQHQFKISIEEL
ncbi:MAG: hypothetical protein PVF65_01265 [Sphingomonadales bacterium]